MQGDGALHCVAPVSASDAVVLARFRAGLLGWLVGADAPLRVPPVRARAAEALQEVSGLGE